jgi:hypothetical protein
MWFVAQGCIILAVVGMPVIIWKKLGDPIYLETLPPDALKRLGAKLIKGENGRVYAEPPPVAIRLQQSLLGGVVFAILLACFYKWVMPLLGVNW